MASAGVTGSLFGGELPGDGPEQGLTLAQVAVGRPVRGEFTYAVPDPLVSSLLPGQRVLVPFGRGRAVGFYLGPPPASQAPRTGRLRSIEKLLDERPALTPELIALLRFAAEHYRYPLGEAIRTALPPGLSGTDAERVAEPDRISFAQASKDADPSALRRAPAQAASLSYLLAVGGRASVDEIAHAVPGARDALKRLAQRGWVALTAEELRKAPVEGLGSSRPGRLTGAQQAAVETLTSALDGGGFRPFLLHGVTGSGKTEVYLRASEHALGRGRGVLVLVPEIALTPQLVGRFRSRFGPTVAVLHSALKDRERLRHWQALRAGATRIVVGVRSAVFAPVVDLGLIVVDEEHDGSFKQDEKLRYQARDLAVVRAKQGSAAVVLGSATPSLETLENARRGRYELLTLPGRVDDRPMPRIELVDLRLQRPRGPQPAEEPSVLSPPLLEAMGEVLARGQQTILFLNRRGHSTFLLCEVCGEGVRCRFCDVSLTHHRSSNRVLCHYCADSGPVPERCACGGGLLRLGAGTERVEAEVAERFSQARVGRLDRDSAGSAEQLTDLLSSFARRELDILVGTQMVAKGHDFPGVTLVCVVMADTALSLPDFRAAERTFQLLTQVSGRAGRGEDAGRVLIQSYNPEAEAIGRVLAHDFEGFVEGELAWRRQLAYPPFARMAAIRIDGAHPEQTRDVARLLAERAAARMPPASVGVRLLGPAPASIPRIKGRMRWQLLLKGPTHGSLAGPLGEVERALPELPSGVRVVIDVDPGAML